MGQELKATGTELEADVVEALEAAVLAGDKARAVLARVARTELNNELKAIDAKWGPEIDKQAAAKQAAEDAAKKQAADKLVQAARQLEEASELCAKLGVIEREAVPSANLIGVVTQSAQSVAIPSVEAQSVATPGTDAQSALGTDVDTLKLRAAEKLVKAAELLEQAAEKAASLSTDPAAKRQAAEQLVSASKLLTSVATPGTDAQSALGTEAQSAPSTDLSSVEAQSVATPSVETQSAAI